MSFIIQPLIQVKLIRIRTASSHRRAAPPVNKEFVAQVARISNKEPRQRGFIVGGKADRRDDSTQRAGAGGQGHQMTVASKQSPPEADQAEVISCQ